MSTTQHTLDLMRPESPFANLTYMGYGCILADPPWRFDNYSAAGEEKNPVAHYDCMTLAALAAMPVADLAMRDCWLVMWATAPLLDEACDLVRHWGFAFTTAGGWAKESKTGAKIAFGTGYVRRSACEFYLIGKRGDPPIKPAARSIRNLIWDPVREHSRKPDRMYGEIEASFDGPYLELFARTRRTGWAAWGNQTGKFKADAGTASPAGPAAPDRGAFAPAPAQAG